MSNSKPDLTKVKHCRERTKQRGATTEKLRVVRHFGETCPAGHIMLTAKQAKRHIARLQLWLREHKSVSFIRRKLVVKQIIRLIEEMTHWLLIVNTKRNAVVTAYPADEPKRTAFALGRMRPYAARSKSKKKGKRP